MSKDFGADLTKFVEGYRNIDEPGYRYSIVENLRTMAELINKGEPWPAEVKASEAARKAGLVPAAEPTEAEMKRAAADEEAAALARKRGIEDDYTTSAAPDVPQSAKDAKAEREMEELNQPADADRPGKKDKNKRDK